jgi:hypothetical protein
MSREGKLSTVSLVLVQAQRVEAKLSISITLLLHGDNSEKTRGLMPGGDTVSPFDLMGTAPRCGARARRGTSCMASPAMPNGRCRMHGGKSPHGPLGAPNAVIDR